MVMVAAAEEELMIEEEKPDVAEEEMIMDNSNRASMLIGLATRRLQYIGIILQQSATIRAMPLTLSTWR